MGIKSKPDKILFLILWLIISFFSTPGRDIWILTFFQFIPFLYVLKKHEKNWLKISIIFGFLYYILYYKWLIYPVKYVNIPIVFGIINVFLMAIYQTIYFLIFSYFLKKYKNIFITSILWGILELFKANFLTGFPWGEISYNLYSFPLLIQIANYINSEGISAIIIFINLFIFNFFNLNKLEKISGILIIISFISLNLFLFKSYNFKKIDLSISLIQGNIPEEVKLKDENAKLILDTYIDLSKRTNSKLVVWPEAIYTIPFNSDNSSMKKELLSFVKNKKINLIFGSPSIEVDYEKQKYKFYNSIFLIKADLEIFRYDKIKLVPFGEYTPYKKFLSFVNKIVPGEDYSSGKEIKLFKINKYKIIPLICYEGIFHSLIKKGINKGGDFIINISNEAWFGNSDALYQHLAANVLRAVEFRKYFFKCANSGISAIINPKGIIEKKLNPMKKGIINFNP